MAGPLTWRNVDAPDFRGSLAGLSIASNSLDRAFAGLGEGLSRFDASRKEDAASAVLNNSMNYADPAALRAAIADGSVFNGVNRGLLNPAAFAGLDSRAGTLLSQATNQQALDTNRQLDPIRVRSAGLVADGQGLENTYNRDTMGNRVAQVGANLDNTRVGTERARVGIQSDQLGLDRGRFTFGNERQAEADRQAALPWVERARSAVDTQGIYDLLNDPEYRKLPDQARERVQTAIPNIPGFSGVFGAAGGSAPGSVGAGPAIAAAAGGVPGTQTGSPFDASFRFRPTPAPLTSMRIGEVLDHQGDMLRDRGGTPAGAFQITRDTLQGIAPQVLGAGWRDQAFTPEVQDRLAQALFEQRKSGNLSQTWAALPDRGVGGYANMTWEQIRPVIARAEVGGNISSIPQLRSEVAGARVQANRAVSEIAGTQAENRSGGVIPGYTEAQADSRSTDRQIAEKIQQSTYSDLPIGRLTQNIQDLRAHYPGMTAATAGLLLEQSFSASGRFMRNLPTAIGGGQGTPDMTRAVDLAKSAQRGETYRAVEQDQLLGAQGASLVAAQQAHEQAATLLAAAKGRGSLAASQVPRLESQLNRARSALAAAISRQSNDDTTQLSFNRGRDAPGTQPTNVPGALPYARVDTDHLQDPGPAQPAAARPGPTPAAAALLNAVTPPVEAPVDPLAETLRRAAEERQAVITRDDQARAQRAASARTTLVGTATADARELVNSGISLREAAQMAATAPGIRGKGVTVADIEAALRERLARE